MSAAGILVCGDLSKRRLHVYLRRPMAYTLYVYVRVNNDNMYDINTYVRRKCMRM